MAVVDPECRVIGVEGLRVADELGETEPPTEAELAALRALRTKGGS